MNTVQLFKAGDTVIVETFEKPLSIEGVVKREEEFIYTMENKIIGETQNSGILIDETLEYNNAIGIIQAKKDNIPHMIKDDKGWSYTLLNGKTIAKRVATKIYPAESKEEVKEIKTENRVIETVNNIVEYKVNVDKELKILDSKDIDLVFCYREVLKDLLCSINESATKRIELIEAKLREMEAE